MVRKSKEPLLSKEERIRLAELWLGDEASALKNLDEFFDACEKAILTKQRTPYWVGTTSSVE